MRNKLPGEPSTSSPHKSLAEEIFNTIREPMLVLDKSLRVQQASTPFYKHFQATPEDTLGLPVYDLGNGQWNIPELCCLLENVLPDNTVFNDFEVHHTFETIGERTILLNARRIDHLQLILLAMEDITERKQLEDSFNTSRELAHKALAEIEDLYRNAPVGLCVLDRELRYVRINSKLAEINGIPAAEHIGKTVCEVLPQLGKSMEKALLRVIKTGKPRHDVEIIGETPAEPGVKRSWMEQWLPIFNEEGCVTGINIVALETTARKKVEEALKENENFLEKVLNSSLAGMYIYDLNQGTNIFINQQYTTLLGYTRDDLDKMSEAKFTSLFHPEDVGQVMEHIQALARAADNDILEIEYRFRTKDGRWIWCLSEDSVFKRGEDGSVVQFIGTFLDITDRKKTEENLQKAKSAAEAASLAKSEFLANMSHEIRTPMTVFLSALEHLSEIDKDPQHQKLLQMADKSARHLRGLIDDILDFSQIEAGHIELYVAPLEVRTWVDDTITMLFPLAQEKNLGLSSVVEDEVPAMVEADSTRLKQILTNLIGNAIKFTLEGEVKVRVRTAGNHLEFVVTDTGIGIPRAKLPLLFKSFSQIDTTFHRQFGGTGLGLAISQSLVKKMGGEITVQSRVGKGSEFAFTIPLQQPAISDEERLSRSGVSADAENSCRILLVEDDPMIRELFLMGLGQENWQVEAAGSGEEALMKCLQTPFDVILMDVQMPGMDGLEVTRRIRAEEAPGKDRMCILGLTAHARKKVIEDCMQIGMDEVLIKPISTNELEDGILRCLNKKSR